MSRRSGRLSAVASSSLETAQANLGRVDDILSFHSKSQDPSPGAPPSANASLVLGATALTYAAWEVYVEDLAVEAVGELSRKFAPSKVPSALRKQIVDGCQKWDLVGDGWRRVWRDRVEREARGVTNQASFGLNTANPENVIKLFALVGISPFSNVRWKNATTKQVKARVQKLVSDRSAVVHTGKAPSGYGLNQARNHLVFVRRLLPVFDGSVGRQAGDLLGSTAIW